ncbi:hypothetical protein [Paenibacillus protaetiae]|uniref:Uncharacterized protein n=1 Tax=Paenibacillus protaetiae TaxID=2509456 RepID=A0A4V0YEX7_9BACL|nr:hypothetical protein [Paenibacillus protaetiae]QAY65751.1 hypothetical protein ET464_04520 [Paenibacillus protaetiae]
MKLATPGGDELDYGSIGYEQPQPAAFFDGRQQVLASWHSSRFSFPNLRRIEQPGACRIG